ncbi:ROK family protein [uncultured Vagococcus sp.]|uniref:ROK family protein n=1 Tax=uncultured Vagococcus sp. TaxID=189676 RepID=UPI0028D64946|nr:ROK family protein [uncultured Vagococcus sp.]
MTYIGIDVGGSYIKYGVVNRKGQLLFSDKQSTDRSNPQAVVQTIVAISSLLQQRYEIKGIGISIPGVINHENRLITSGAIVGLHEIEVSQLLARQTGKPIVLVNDANAIGYGEQWVGNGKNCQNFVCLPLGTGVGGAIIVNGQLLKGRTGAAGEFGMALMGLGKTEPVAYESASLYCGAVAGLCRIYSTKLGKPNAADWTVDIPHILKLAEEGDQKATESLGEFYQNTAVLLLNIAVTIDPEKILIGGGVSDSPIIMAGIEKAVKQLLARYTVIENLGFPQLSRVKLGNTAGMIGAVSQLIERNESDGKNGKIYR